MLFIMFCEFFYLLTWALIGVSVSWNIVPEIFHNIPYIFLGAAHLPGRVHLLLPLGRSSAASPSSKKPLLKSFHVAKWHYYPTIILIRSPALVGAVWVYSMAAGLFGVDIPFTQMIGVLPLIFFGTLIPGPFRAFAVALWPTLFPEHVAEMAIFGFVQHNFFLLFNAGYRSDLPEAGESRSCSAARRPLRPGPTDIARCPGFARALSPRSALRSRSSVCLTTARR